MSGETPIEKLLLKDRYKRTKNRLGFKALEGIFMVSKLPLFPRLHPWMQEDKTDMRWLPINEDIEMPADAPVPLDLLDELIEEASHRVVYDECGCRIVGECKKYPRDIGCLLMGDSALESSQSVSREVSADEAKAHTRRAVEAGLVPIVGKARVDNFLFGIKDRARMLTVCYCCECCCITRFTRHSRLEDLEPLFPRLESISIEVTDDCTGCGNCVERCYMEAIEVVDGKAVISDYCRVCGRCAIACPSNAIRIRIDDPDFLQKTRERIRSYVKYD